MRLRYRCGSVGPRIGDYIVSLRGAAAYQVHRIISVKPEALGGQRYSLSVERVPRVEATNGYYFTLLWDRRHGQIRPSSSP